MICDRCHKNTASCEMSYFNDDFCCIDCISIETTHRLYSLAKKSEKLAIQKGNVSFSGIGLPKELCTIE